MSIEEKEPWANFSLQLRRDQRDALLRIATERQLSMADVAREAFREYLAADAAKRLEAVAA